MDLTRKQRSAIRKGIDALYEVNHNKHAVGANLYKLYGAESQEKHWLAQQKILLAIGELERLLSEEKQDENG